jgi:hypothetical protein
MKEEGRGGVEGGGEGAKGKTHASGGTTSHHHPPHQEKEEQLDPSLSLLYT